MFSAGFTDRRWKDCRSRRPVLAIVSEDAEVVSAADWLLIPGLGAYIETASTTGNFAEMLVGIIVMACFVVGLNRLFWRRLYRIAETRFSL